MRHLLIALLISLIGYSLWFFASPKERRQVRKQAGYHLARFGALVVIIFGALLFYGSTHSIKLF